MKKGCYENALLAISGLPLNNERIFSCDVNETCITV